MSTIACPLAGCSQEHELKHAKNKAATPFISCPTWGSSIIWLRSPAASEFLNANNGGRIRGARANPEEGVRAPARCSKCGHPLIGSEATCPGCSRELDWNDVMEVPDDEFKGDFP